MSKILCTVVALLILVAVYPVSAQARGGHFGGAWHGGSHGAFFGGAWNGGSHGAFFGDARFGAAPWGARYYGGVYRRVRPAWGGVYRGGVWPGRYYGHYHGNWRESYSPNWGWGVAAGLLATAPAYSYYDVGFGDDYGFEVPAYNSAVANCMQRFRSFDPASGTYIGRDGNPHPCP